jgi:outer membrane receptor protein involved in Fe transport
MNKFNFRLFVVLGLALLPYLSFAQTGDDIRVEDFLFEMQKTYNISIICEKELIDGRFMPKNFKAKGRVEKILVEALEIHHLELKKIDDRNFVVKKGEKYQPLLSKKESITGTLTGIVKDETGAPLQGVHVYIANTNQGTFTDRNGAYQLEQIPEGSFDAEISYMGYVTRKVEFKITQRHRKHRFDFNLAPDLLSLQTIIITGVTHPIISLESGVAASSISENDIFELAPRSTADILQKIPGFYIETSNGEAGNNLFSRGMPSEGSFQYVTFQEDGLPIYEGGNIDWMPMDMYHKVDGTVKLIEGVRSGSSGIFSSNAPGGIINFMNKTGGSKTKGSAKMQTSSFGQIRAEAEVGGAIKEGKWHYHLGGYYRIDNGIRSPGFVANNGGQIKGNITRIFNNGNGYVRISAKYMNDRNILYSSVPIKNTRRPLPIDDFNANYGTMTTVNARTIELPTNTRGVYEQYNLSDGMHGKLGYIGTHTKIDLGSGWSINNKNRYSLIRNDVNAILSVHNAMNAEEFARNKKIQGNVTPVYTYANDGSIFNSSLGNGMVMESGWLANQQDMYNLINSFEVSKETEKYQASANIYVSNYSNKTNRRWANILLEASGEEPRPLDLTYYDDNGFMVQAATYNGFTNFALEDSYLGAEGKAFVAAIYFYGKYHLAEGTFADGGVRLESLQANGSVENTALYNIEPELQENSVISNVRYSNNISTPYSVGKLTYSWTIGFNHMFHEEASFFVRFSDGFRTPDFDNWHQNQETNGGRVERIFQSELGYKLSSKRYALLFSSFYSYIANQVSTLSIYTSDEVIIEPFERNAQTFGGELEAIAQFTKHFSLDITATLQKATYLVDNTTVVNPEFRINGNEVKRIPNVYFILKPTYEIRGVKIFGTAQYIGERFSNEINVDILPRFISLNLGASYKYKSYRFLLHAQNLTNEIGLTDGNPRILSENRNEQTRMAKPILGRSIVAVATYQF